MRSPIMFLLSEYLSRIEAVSRGGPIPAAASTASTATTTTEKTEAESLLETQQKLFVA